MAQDSNLHGSIFKKHGLLINTILSYPLDFEKPLMPTVGANVIGGTQLSPYRYELGAGTGNIPTFNLLIVEPSESEPHMK